MATERKVEQVALLEERLQRATVTIGFDYRGLSVGEMQEMRRAIRAEAPDTELRVIKNSLLARAAANAGIPDAAKVAQQSTALLFWVWGVDGCTAGAAGLHAVALGCERDSGARRVLSRAHFRAATRSRSWLRFRAGRS